MAVYILHFSMKLHHAQHYVGWASRVNDRVEHHRNGTGARLTQVLNELGIAYEVARVFKNADRSFERKLKNVKNTKFYCPICMGNKARNYQPEVPETNISIQSD